MSPERIAGGCRQLQKAGLRLGPGPAGRARARVPSDQFTEQL